MGEAKRHLSITRAFDFPQEIRLYTRGNLSRNIDVTITLNGQRDGADFYLLDYTFWDETDESVDQTVARYFNTCLILPAFALCPHQILDV